MIVIRYTTLSGSTKEFKFSDEKTADAFLAGLESFRKEANIVTIDKQKI